MGNTYVRERATIITKPSNRVATQEERDAWDAEFEEARERGTYPRVKPEDLSKIVYKRGGVNCSVH